jgi:hypothetical protein
MRGGGSNSSSLAKEWSQRSELTNDWEREIEKGREVAWYQEPRRRVFICQSQKSRVRKVYLDRLLPESIPNLEFFFVFGVEREGKKEGKQ